MSAQKKTDSSPTTVLNQPNTPHKRAMGFPMVLLFYQKFDIRENKIEIKQDCNRCIHYRRVADR